MKKSVHTTKPRPKFVPGELIVRLKEDVAAEISAAPRARRGSAAARSMPTVLVEPVRALAAKHGLKEMVPVFAAKSARPKGGLRGAAMAAASFRASVMDPENEGLRGINFVRVSPKTDTEALAKELSQLRGVEYAHPVAARWPCSPQRIADPMQNRQWGLRAIRWFDALPLPDHAGVGVAVLDSGVDRSHPDLKEMVRSYVHEGASAQDIIGHGTHVAGIIAAASNNRIGISGVAVSDLHIWKVFGDQPADDGEYYVDELMYQRAFNAARNTPGVRVVNLSLGGTYRDQTEALLIRRLIDRGIVVVAAMGNEYEEGNPVEYPGAHPGVIAVGALTETNRRASFSNTGAHIDLCAPGANILSTLPLKISSYRGKEDTEYNAWDGTSMATPHVAAAVAVLLGKEPGLTPADVSARLRRSAAKVTEMGGKARTRQHGSGLLDLKALLA